jgi:hypothetical protein
MLAKSPRCTRGPKPFVSDNLPAVDECLLLDLAQRDDFGRTVGQPQDFCNHEQRTGGLLQDATSDSLISAVAQVAPPLLQQRASTLAHQNTWAIEQSFKHGRASERGRAKDGGSTMRTEVMWRPPGEERRQQRRSGAGRHITVVATQPKLCDGPHNVGHIDRGGPIDARRPRPPSVHSVRAGERFRHRAILNTGPTGPRINREGRTRPSRNPWVGVSGAGARVRAPRDGATPGA